MAKVHATKAFHFFEDGTTATTWAHCTLVPDSDPKTYEYETRKKTEIDRLRKVDDNQSDNPGSGGKGATPPTSTRPSARPSASSASSADSTVAIAAATIDMPEGETPAVQRIGVSVSGQTSGRRLVD